MSEIPQEELTRQVRQHTDSLRAAGIDWLPKGPAIVAMARPTPEPASAAELVKSLPVVTESVPAAQTSLLTADPGDGLSPEQRREALAALARQVAQCTRCAGLAATRTQTVFGVGPLDPDLCFIGEAPGADEDRQGEPFVGAAGQLLNRIIEACGMKREEVFICNIIRCRPPGNRQPLPDEAANCKEYLERTLELVRPKYICALGATAVKYLTGTNLGISKLRGRFLDYNGIPVMATYHPAYLLPSRNPAAKRDVWEDMKRLLVKMGKPIPGSK
jgi:uracil-DNA glycosylase family 4